MLRASNCVRNIMGRDRDEVVREHYVATLPSAEDLDRVAEEEKIRQATGVINTEKK